jgi:hypothetical protein
MDEQECSISYCGVEDEPLLLVCPNGHRLHPTCARMLLGSTFPRGMTCPQCRDGSLNRVVVTTMPTPIALACTPFSALASVIAMRIGAKEILKLTTHQ